jgi:hypothetical protein
MGKIGIILSLILKTSPFSVLFQFGGEVAPASHRNFGTKRRYFWRLEL